MLNSIGIKIRLALTLLSLVALCGCAHQYLMHLRDGDLILSSDKPTLQGTSYHFTDSMGVKHAIAQNRVVKIRAVSVVRPEQKPAASKSPESAEKLKKPKHWYFLWLA
jgi:hypothetical protein